MDNILVPVAPGEVLDKITILQIKSERMTDPAQLAHVRLELGVLRSIWQAAVTEDAVTRSLYQQLMDINRALWDIEDGIRDKERAAEFDQQFIELARSVYRTNDQRSQVKKQLNLHLGSTLIEEKSYQAY